MGAQAVSPRRSARVLRRHPRRSARLRERVTPRATPSPTEKTTPRRGRSGSTTRSRASPPASGDRYDALADARMGRLVALLVARGWSPGIVTEAKLARDGSATGEYVVCFGDFSSDPREALEALSEREERGEEVRYALVDANAMERDGRWRYLDGE